MRFLRVVKCIFVSRELPILFLAKCEMADFCVVKRDFHNISIIIVRETKITFRIHVSREL